MVRFLDWLGPWPFLAAAVICAILGFEHVAPSGIGWYMAAASIVLAGTLGFVIGSAGAIRSLIEAGYTRDPSMDRRPIKQRPFDELNESQKLDWIHEQLGAIEKKRHDQ